MLRLSRYTDLFHCSRFITGFLKNLCTPDLPSLSKIATFSMISNTAFAVSTVLSMLYLITILQNMDNGTVRCGVFIDLKKAFDTVKHEILLAKLENYGITGVINSWQRSYLTARKQTTEVNDVVSEAETTLCGVPQGSVLGPLLFLLYISDIYNSSSLFAFYLFADDTSIILANYKLMGFETLVKQTVFEHKKNQTL